MLEQKTFASRHVPGTIRHGWPLAKYETAFQGIPIAYHNVPQQIVISVHQPEIPDYLSVPFY
jgi:hypothetical protein